jgi:hypothetical protein
MLQQAELGGKEEHFSVIPFSYAGLQFFRNADLQYSSPDD